jgi:hypothetical protein
MALSKIQFPKVTTIIPLSDIKKPGRRTNLECSYLSSRSLDVVWRLALALRVHNESIYRLFC